MGRFTLAVRDYLDTCDANAAVLSSKYHPTEDGAVKAVPHRGHRDKEADQAAEAEIRATFRAERSRPAGKDGQR